MILHLGGAARQFDPLCLLAAYLSAVVHDYEHGGQCDMEPASRANKAGSMSCYTCGCHRQQCCRCSAQPVAVRALLKPCTHMAGLTNDYLVGNMTSLAIRYNDRVSAASCWKFGCKPASYIVQAAPA